MICCLSQLSARFHNYLSDFLSAAMFSGAMSRHTAAGYRNELQTGRTTKTGRVLLAEEIEHRCSALRSYTATCQPRYREENLKVIRDAEEKLKPAPVPAPAATPREQIGLMVATQEQHTQKLGRIEEKLDKLLEKKKPAVKGTVPCPHVITRGKAEGTVCGSFSCTHKARLEAQQKAEKAETTAAAAELAEDFRGVKIEST